MTRKRKNSFRYLNDVRKKIISSWRLCYLGYFGCTSRFVFDGFTFPFITHDLRLSVESSALFILKRRTVRPASPAFLACVASVTEPRGEISMKCRVGILQRVRVASASSLYLYIPRKRERYFVRVACINGLFPLLLWHTQLYNLFSRCKYKYVYVQGGARHRTRIMYTENEGGMICYVTCMCAV